MSLSGRLEMKKRVYGVSKGAMVAVAAVMLMMGLPATVQAQQEQQRAIELEVIEIESEVPRRVAQFFVQRDQLQYQPMDDQPSFMPELLDSVDKDPF